MGSVPTQSNRGPATRGYGENIMLTRSVVMTMSVLVSGFLLAQDARAQRDFVYEARQVRNLKIDGVFNEWFDAEMIVFDQLKDVGADIPDSDDFSGMAMIGWNENDPDRVYFAVDITDDELQDIHPPGDVCGKTTAWSLCSTWTTHWCGPDSFSSPWAPTGKTCPQRPRRTTRNGSW